MQSRGTLLIFPLHPFLLAHYHSLHLMGGGGGEGWLRCVEGSKVKEGIREISGRVNGGREVMVTGVGLFMEVEYGGGMREWMGRLLAWSTFTSMYLEAVIKNRSDNWIVYRSSTFRLKRNTSHNKQYYFLTVTL